MGALRRGWGLRLAIVVILGIIWACSAPVPAAQAHAIILVPLRSAQLVGPRHRGIALLRQEADAPPDSLAYPPPALGPGEYQARWKVVAADGHVTEGTMAFTVAAS